MVFKPTFTITEPILNTIARIYSSVAIIEKSPLIPKWVVSLRRDALVRNAHASTAIEGNPLSLEDVTDLASGRKIMVQRKAKAEVLNYLNVLENIPKLAEQSFSEKLILNIHKLLTKNVLDDSTYSGKYRKMQVVVGNRTTGKVRFKPPKPSEVSALMKKFVKWLHNNNEERNPVIEAGIAHYEFVRIHPFIDGNGRTARTLASLILFKRGFDSKRFFALDDYYDSDRPSYYKALQSVDPKTKDMTKWLEYFSEGVMIQVEEVRKRVLTLIADIQKTKSKGQIALDEKQMKIVEFIHKNGKATNRDLQKMFAVSHKTATGYLSQMLKMRVVNREGKGRSVFYKLA